MKDKKCLWIHLIGAFITFSVHASTQSTMTQSLKNQLKIDSTSNNGSTNGHHIGDCYGGGVVFYIHKDTHAPAGQRGLISAPTDTVGSFNWDIQAGGQDVPKTQAPLFTGTKNTQSIIAKVGKNRAQAASAATNYAYGSYHDWYLPSQHELSTMYFSSLTSGANFWKKCGATAPSAATYWSSTQHGASDAWAVSFAGGIVVVAKKNNPLMVRAVRAF